MKHNCGWKGCLKVTILPANNRRLLQAMPSCVVHVWKGGNAIACLNSLV